MLIQKVVERQLVSVPATELITYYLINIQRDALATVSRANDIANDIRGFDMKRIRKNTIQRERTTKERERETIQQGRGLRTYELEAGSTAPMSLGSHVTVLVLGE